MATPQVLDIFQIIINFIWRVINYPIHLGNGVYITIFYIMAFIFILITLLNVFQLQIPKFSAGWDSYGKFSVAKTNRIKKGK